MDRLAWANNAAVLTVGRSAIGFLFFPDSELKPDESRRLAFNAMQQLISGAEPESITTWSKAIDVPFDDVTKIVAQDQTGCVEVHYQHGRKEKYAHFVCVNADQALEIAGELATRAFGTKLVESREDSDLLSALVGPGALAVACLAFLGFAVLLGFLGFLIVGVTALFAIGWGIFRVLYRAKVTVWSRR
jgi:hypothetical protein